MLRNLDNIYAWVILAVSIVQMVVTGWAYSLCFRVRVSRAKFVVVLAVISVVILVPQIFLGFYIPLKTAVLFFVTFAVLRLMSEANTVKAFIFCAFDMMINVCIDMLLLGIMVVMNMNDFQTSEDIYTFDRMIASLIFTVMCIPLKYLYSVLWNKIVNRTVSAKLNPTLILFPLAQIFAMICIVADHAGNQLSLIHI